MWRALPNVTIAQRTGACYYPHMMKPIANAWEERWGGKIPPEFHPDLAAMMRAMFTCGFISALKTITETPEDSMEALISGASAEALKEGAGMMAMPPISGMVS